MLLTYFYSTARAPQRQDFVRTLHRKAKYLQTLHCIRAAGHKNISVQITQCLFMHGISLTCSHVAGKSWYIRNSSL